MHLEIYTMEENKVEQNMSNREDLDSSSIFISSFNLTTKWAGLARSLKWSTKAHILWFRTKFTKPMCL